VRCAGSPRTDRGGAWVAVQAALLAAIFLSALVGLGWPDAAEPFAWLAAGLLLAAGAALLVAGGVGLGNALTPFPAPRPQAELQTDGIYRRVRHPMYGGGILLALGWSLLFASPLGLVLTLALAVFADLKSRREERWLAAAYPGYAAYRARTRRRLIPFLW
jgi:protein-S-isoprenylcysteine O-methyltransferase Ste14